jgi:hypothetical protein
MTRQVKQGVKADRLTTAYPELCRQRISGSKALTRLLDVANGKADPDPARDQVCFRLLNKVLPDLKAIEHSGQVDGVHTVLFNPK